MRRITWMNFMQVCMGVFLVSSIYFVSEISTSLNSQAAISMLNHRNHIRGKHAQHVLHRHNVDGFHAAMDFLDQLHIDDTEPFFVLLVSSKLSNGKYWCGDCEVAAPIFNEVLAATSVRHLLVDVGDRGDWYNMSNGFRTDPRFQVDEIPALLRYDPVTKSNTPLLTGAAFLSDAAILRTIFQTPPQPALPTTTHITTFPDMVEYLRTYETTNQTHSLFVYFVSGANAAGKLWCPFCAKAELPVTTYFKYFAPSDAVLLRVVTASSLQDWKRADNPFKVQKVITISGLPMVIRANPQRDMTTEALHFEEFTAFFEETAQLATFFQGGAYA
ncbi:Aste57867_767 [Aphanomyces stellatus]|uniref:Aste57867_767 protein n=1 Tax=Aphanomyces stellatus TaxID=120398 RepID=A0A485K7J8_9STRA|nr:hypothetical protein As57867_000766 [Aphanomyces stellatus]VFT77991.1 Aste57867_767 [Aphanomyces stellatus]